jgi:flavodoxin
MLSLIVYESDRCNTEAIARVLGDEFSRTRPTLLVRLDDMAYRIPVGVDLLVIGSSTQNRRPTPLLDRWLQALDPHEVRGLTAVVFDTRSPLPGWLSGSAAREITRLLLAKGAHILEQPMSFFADAGQGHLLDGELERARRWAQMVGDRSWLHVRPVFQPIEAHPDLSLRKWRFHWLQAKDHQGTTTAPSPTALRSEGSPPG